MPVQALQEGYRGERRDAKANFHGNQVIYIRWEHHQWFCAGKAFPLPPQMTWGDVVNDVLPEAFGQHPDFAAIDWSEVEWSLDGKRIRPQAGDSLEALGADHKSSITFVTPSMKYGLAEAGV